MQPFQDGNVRNCEYHTYFLLKILQFAKVSKSKEASLYTWPTSGRYVYIDDNIDCNFYDHHLMFARRSYFRCFTGLKSFT